MTRTQLDAYRGDDAAWPTRVVAVACSVVLPDSSAAPPLAHREMKDLAKLLVSLEAIEVTRY